MHRVDTDGNVGNLFDDSAPGGPAPTLVDAAILNAFQEELANFIATDAGIALVKGTNTQLGAAIRKLYLRPGTSPSYGVDLTGAEGLFFAARDNDRTAGAGRQRCYLKTDNSFSGGNTELWLTINAAWDIGDLLWTKDTAAPAFAIVVSSLLGIRLLTNPSGAGGTFDDDAWTHPHTIFHTGRTADWIDTGGGTTPWGYSKDPSGVVRIEGNVSASGTFPSTIANLPPGYRKNTIQRFSSSYIDGGAIHQHCTIQIAANGAITTDAAMGGQVRLDGITFIADS